MISGAIANAQSPIQSISGPAPLDYFGSSVRFTGDLNGDGIVDFVAGATQPTLVPSGGGSAYSSPGYVNTVSGANFSIIASKPGPSNGSLYGTVAVGIGDTNGDGIKDILAGGLDTGGLTLNPAIISSMGPAFVDLLSGPSASFLYNTSLGTSLGIGPPLTYVSAAPLGDFNHDGVEDYIVGGSAFSAPVPPFFVSYNLGTIKIVSGANGGVLYQQTGTAAGDLGAAVAGLGDINNDGTVDFAFSNPKAAYSTFPSAGFVYIYSGASTTQIRSHHGFSSSAGTGTCLGAAGDMNADGVADYYIGSPLSNSYAAGRGDVTIYSGTFGSIIHTYTAVTNNGYTGRVAASAGDFNLDGIPEFVIRSTTANNNNYGNLLVFDGTDGTLIYQLGNSANAGFGAAVDGGGDVNADGLPDLLVSIEDNITGSGQGVVTAYSMTPDGIQFYGTGTPGCFGIQHLTTNSAPKIGNNGFEFRVDRMSTVTPNLLLVSDTQDVAGSDWLNLGILLHVLVDGTTTELFALDLHTIAVGFAAAPIMIPNDPFIVGNQYYGQAINSWLGPCVPTIFSLSSSRGVIVTILP